MSGIENIPDQLGHAIVNAMTGSTIKAGGDLEGDDATLQRLYQIFLNSLRSLGDESFHRLSVTFGSYAYVVTLGGDSGEKCLYILKSPSP